MKASGGERKLFTGLFRGQLTVPRPTLAELEARASPVGPIFQVLPSTTSTSSGSDVTFSVQGGPYDSVWIRVFPPSGRASSATSGAPNLWSCLRSLIRKVVALDGKIDRLDAAPLEIDTSTGRDRAEPAVEDEIDFVHGGAGAAAAARPSTSPRSPDAAPPKKEPTKRKPLSYPLYVALCEDSPEQVQLLHGLKQCGFRFHHIWDQEEHRPSELIYYRWCGPEKDRVPPYSTTQGGVGVLIFSPDQTKLLFVFEYGWWKPVTGMVNRNESKFEAVRRECEEEVGLRIQTSTINSRSSAQLEKHKQPIMTYLGGWQSGGQWDRVVNDEFSVFAVTAVSENDLKPDGEEINEAKWVDVGKIPVLEKFDATNGGTNQEVLVEGLGRINPMVCRWLWNWQNGKGFDCFLGTASGINAAERMYIGLQ
eukprot:g20557.t1